MNSLLRQRLAFSLCFILIAMLCGGAAGYYTGRHLALRLTAEMLSDAAELAIKESVAYSVDAHTMLDAMNASTDEPCSEADLEHLQRLLYPAHLLKEAGRIRDGKILCSTTLGRTHLPEIVLPAPDMIGADGVKVYRNPPFFSLKRVTVTALQKGDSYVILNPYIASLRPRSPIRTRITVITLQPANDPGPVQSRDYDGRFEQVLYSTRCSFQYNSCATATLSLAQALQLEREQMQDGLIAGGILGALIGLILAMYYQRSRSMEGQLRRALRHKKLTLAYQPIVDLVTGHIVEAEALARWTDEDGFAIRPDVFVALAEERGFINQLTGLVLRQVLQDFAGLLRQLPDFRLNINVTAADLSDPRFLRLLEEELDKAGVAPQSLAIEVTESSMVRTKTAMETIRILKERGHSVQIDDFGTGFSSLSYLKDLSIDTIKIDGSFIRAIGTDSVTLGILPQILSMAETLNLQVIAEGIETVEQAGYFACISKPVLGQGWYCGRPMPAADLLKILEQTELNAMQQKIQQNAGAQRPPAAEEILTANTKINRP